MNAPLKDKIIKEFKGEIRLTTFDLSKKFKISRQAIHRHLQALLKEEKIIQQGSSRKTTFYLLNHPASIKKILGTKAVIFKKTYKSTGLEEEAVFSEALSHCQPIKKNPDNAKTILHYAFTEIVNNAVDHSGAASIDVLVSFQPAQTFFTVTDHGVGIFKNIQDKKALSNEMEALQDVLKGKQTTQPEYHSGEGIFFTSKIADKFIIESHRKKLTIDNRLEDIFVSDARFRKGTQVTFYLKNNAKQKLEEVFRQYTNEEFQFQKSKITVKLFQQGEEYMSRSQAKRLLHALDRFQEILLDFSGVHTVGQGFADEIFRVFVTQHPKIAIHAINTNENVDFMIHRTQKKSY